MLTQDQLAQNLLAQLRLLDPSVSAEIGTPERKILDTIAQAISESQIDITLLSGALDLDAKFGSDLDAFVGLFGFGRQTGSFATGFITFGRSNPSSYDITAPRGTQVQANTAINGVTSTVTFQTTAAAVLAAGQTEVTAPIQALIAGSQGAVAANTITQFANLGSPPMGITSVTNPLATTNGADTETDAELKVRFRNTIFRNLAGTQDQYMALALSTQFSTKANVIGPISRYQEYIQVPNVDDATSDPEDGPGNGVAGQWTTTPSGNPYAQYIYTGAPYFVSNGNFGGATIFYRTDTDFTLNAPPLVAGDTYREFNEGPPDITDPSATPFNPNITFFNVYTGSNLNVALPTPGAVVLLEYSYLSAESRNNLARNITNCVDIYVNGQNPTTASDVLPPPPGGLNLFSANVTDKFYYQNFRRIGRPQTSPVVGNIFTQLFWQPVIALPSQIVVVADGTTHTFGLGTDYWAVEDTTLIGNTVRSRNGIEWTTSAVNTIADSGVTSLTVPGYTYDANIGTLQAALDRNKQITTDVLAHRAARRYFKLDLTIVYAPGASVASANQSISTAIARFFNGQYFGSVIQLSDLLVVVRSASGVQNARWSNDVIHAADDGGNTQNRVTECDVNGTPLSAPAVVYNTDFYLRDSELPKLPNGSVSGDTLSGLILRPRAENTFNFN